MSTFLVISTPYLCFTITDGALRILCLLKFHQLGFSPFQIASLFIFYEIAGVFTNFLGGWMGSVFGINRALLLGISIQVIALSALSLENTWQSILWVMLLQGLAGIAKDLIKVGSKSSLKVILPQNQDNTLFKWVSLLTGSKNALKGIGFLLGGLLLGSIGFKHSLLLLAALLFILTLPTFFVLPKHIGKAKKKPSPTHLFSKPTPLKILSLARFFLFASRDIWFVISLPIFIQTQFNWNVEQTSAFLALWVIGYGLIQTIVPKLLPKNRSKNMPTLSFFTGLISLFPIGIAVAILFNFQIKLVLIVGLAFYNILFAINSILHSYLVLEFSHHDRVSTDVGFYYMANAIGRLTGTLLSGWTFQHYTFSGSLIGAAILLACASIVSLPLPKQQPSQT